MSMPKTPFSAPLSRSARETEGRIRNIFQSKRRRPAPPVLLLGALAILLCTSLVSCRTGAAAPEDSPAPTGAPEPEPIRVGDYLVPPEPVTRDVNGAQVSFSRCFGDGWSLDVPAGWTENWILLQWQAPDGSMSFSVAPCSTSMRNVKAQYGAAGSWPYQTGMPEPFHEYYDGGLHETQPDGTAWYQYYFVPVSDAQSYVLVCCGVYGQTTAEDWALLHTVLQSFTVGEDLHAVLPAPYRAGDSELTAALTGLADPENPLWLYTAINGCGYEREGRSGAHPEQYADALRAFSYTLVGRVDGEPTPEELRDRANLCFGMEELGCNLYFYENSDAVYLYWRGAEYRFTAADPAQPGASPYEAARAWFDEAEELN